MKKLVFTASMALVIIALFAGAALTSKSASVQAQWSPLPTPFSQPSARFGAGAYIHDENVGTASIPVYLSAATWQLVTVNCRTYDGTATPYADYTPVNVTLIFNPGETVKYCNVWIADDTVSEPDKTIYLALSNPANAFLSEPGTAVLTIRDNDVAPQLSVQFSSAAYSVGESDGAANITIYLNRAVWQEVSVNFSTQDGAAQAYADYTPVNTTLVFAPGETTKTSSVPIVKDAVAESSETVNLFLSNPVNAALGAPSTAVLTIVEGGGGCINCGQCRYTHIVQRGDTLYALARRYGTTVWAIADANRIMNPNLIFVGQRLCIP